MSWFLHKWNKALSVVAPRINKLACALCCTGYNNINMKKLLVAGLVLMLLSVNETFGYNSGIAIQTEKSSNMSVYVNGKLYNKQPGKFVRIKSTAGLFHIQVRVLNPYDKVWYIVRKDIKAVKGYEQFYRVVFAPGKKPQLQAGRKYPVYSKYFLNPVLYNKHPVS